MREAATAIKGVLDLYKLNTQAQVNEESQKVMAALEKARRPIRPSRPIPPSRATAGAATMIPTTGWNRFRGKGGSDGGRVAGLLHIHYIIGLDAIAGIRADGQYKGG